MGDVHSNTINFNMPEILDRMPRYIYRGFKFLARGYKLSDEAEKVLKANLHHAEKERPKRIYSFIKRQIADKDGRKGMQRFKEEFQKFDTTGIWGRSVDSIFSSVWKNIP